MTRLIGLTGLAGAGKNEAATALIASGWKHAAFADAMRKAMLALDPWVDVTDGIVFGNGHQRLSTVITRAGWDDAKRVYPEIRRLLQRFGTEAGRDIHGDACWIELVIAPWMDGDHDLVITDCRYENEAEAIRAQGGIVILIDRPGVKPLPGGHPSENGIPAALIDYTIVNGGTIAELHAATREAAAWMARR